MYTEISRMPSSLTVSPDPQRSMDSVKAGTYGRVDI